MSRGTELIWLCLFVDQGKQDRIGPPTYKSDLVIINPHNSSSYLPCLYSSFPIHPYIHPDSSNTCQCSTHPPIPHSVCRRLDFRR
ncbi:hypothetical protein HOY80DRAFT_964114 [Tuber brumale]|nr:hypothetical protein HOY80DRAFT_964114 [Tuber brumale]